MDANEPAEIVLKARANADLAFFNGLDEVFGFSLKDSRGRCNKLGEVAVDRLLAVLDGRSELALTIIERFSDIAGPGTKGLVNVASTGFKHGTETLHARVKCCRAAG